MSNNKQKNIVIPPIIVAVLLIIAIFPIEEYSYYILLRWVVCLTAVYICFFSYKAERMNWVWIMGIVAIVFNPIVPLHMSKEFWQVIDFVTAVIFIGVVVFLRKEKGGTR